MNLSSRVAKLEALTGGQSVDELECITVDAGGYKLEIPVSLLPTIERIYGHEQRQNTNQ
jgi:hypothetical protein